MTTANGLRDNGTCGKAETLKTEMLKSGEEGERPMFNVHEQYLTKPQVAQLLNVTPRMIARDSS
jgi:hypothetical protein